MSSGISFFTPITGGGYPATHFPVVEFFDDYFDLSEKKLKVITAIDSTQYRVCEVDHTANQIANLLKKVTYFTVIIPLVMLIGKVIARSQYHFLEIQKQDVATTLQSAFRGIQARRTFKQLKAATVTVQSNFRSLKPRREFQALKTAAVTFQAFFRGRKGQGEFQALKAATITIQSRFRGLKPRRDFQSLKAAAVTIQSHFRSAKVRREFQALKASTVTVQAQWKCRKAQRAYKAVKPLKKLLQELVKSEITNFSKISGKYSQLQAADPKSYLRDQSQFEQLKETLSLFESHLRRNDTIINGLKKSLTGFYEETPNLLGITLDQLEECVKSVSNLILSREFEEFLGSQIEITRQKRVFDEMTDPEEIKRQIKQWENFNPYPLAGFQRVTRYQLLGKEILQKARIACSTETVLLVKRAIDRLIESSVRCNTVMKIDDINAFITSHGNRQGEVGSFRFYHLGSWLGSRAEAQSELEKIERDIAFTTDQVLNSVPKKIADPESDEAIVQALNCQIVSLGIRKYIERAYQIIPNGAQKQLVLKAEQVDALKELKESLLKALPWMNQPEERKEVISLIKRIIAEEILFDPENVAEIARLRELSVSLGFG